MAQEHCYFDRGRICQPSVQVGNPGQANTRGSRIAARTHQTPTSRIGGVLSWDGSCHGQDPKAHGSQRCRLHAFQSCPQVCFLRKVCTTLYAGFNNTFQFFSCSALADCEKQCHVEECYSCGQLSQGYNTIGTHISQTSLLLEEQGIAIQRGMVEDLKRHRDLLVSLMELLQRRDRNNFFFLTETLKKRIESNEIKLKNAQESVTSGPPDVDPGQFESLIEKLTMSVAAVSVFFLCFFFVCG